MSPRVHGVKLRPSLAPYVRHIRVAKRERDSAPYVRLPDGELELVIRMDEAGPALHTIGTRRTPLHKPGYEQQEAYLVRFKAGGAYPFFGVPLDELTDRVISAGTLWGATSLRLSDALAQARDTQARIETIEHTLCARLGASTVYEPASAASVRRALRLLGEAPVLPSVEQLAAQLGASTRQLRRGFAAVTGLGPKEYLRVLRFQRALSSATRGETRWGSIAAQHGYYDQAHLIAEFHALSGRRPGELLGAVR